MKCSRSEGTSNQDIENLLKSEQRGRRAIILLFVVIVLIVLACFQLTGLFNGERIAQGFPAIATMFSEMFPPDFSRWQQWIAPMIETVAMSIAGTTMAVLFCIPFAFLAASNTSPSPLAYKIARMILNITRAIPELIMGIVFVAAVGFGMLPGVLALGLHSVGMVGKFFAEAIEHSHPAPIEAARATGASEIQVITHGIMPQVIPQFADVAMYRWEYNFRASTVMGMVGAGGIGTEMIGALRLLDYPQVSAILILIIIAVTVVDSLSNVLRRYFQ